MSIGGIVVWLLVLVSLILFIYMVVKTAGNWGVLNTIMLCLLFIEVWVFLFMTAGVYENRIQATKRADTAVKNLAAAEERLIQLKWGNFDTVAGEQNAVIPVTGEFRRFAAERGRVWSQVQFIRAAGDAYELEMLAPANNVADENNVATPAVNASNVDSLPVNLVVYAFAENVSDDGIATPNYYLGEFTVTKNQAGQITLDPTLPLWPFQTSKINAGDAFSWTLYEMLPIDSHTAFAASGSEPAEDAIFGRMDEEELRSLYSDLPAELAEKIISDYVRDGTQANNEDPPESVWARVELSKEWQTDVDSLEVANATERGHFDNFGRAIDQRLQLDDSEAQGRVTITPDFKNGRTGIIVKEEVAKNELSDSAVVQQRIFVRPLVDYEEAFNRLYVEQKEVIEATALFQRDNAELQKAIQASQQTIAFRQVEGQKLTSDIEHFQQEIELLNAELGKAEGQLTAMKADMSQKYRAIQTWHSQVVGMTN
ncbi:MAG: hypothetical protein KDB03_26535 [Planctomycetales bacterium]|nr:hypothetical protein [Planctomycetales bacterium]